MTDSTTQKRCPKCQALNLIAELPLRDYRCGDCGLELAHLDLTIHGTIRGITGWLLDMDTLVNDRYRIDSVLGKGGFGVTYLVNDLRLHNKRRALKEIPEALFDEHETRLLGRLSHPAIPDITDRFSEQGMVYLVLEFGGNRTLRIEQAQRGGRIALFVLLPWMRQLCDVLNYLHEQTPPIIHRDLKPDNVLLDENGRIMLIDFGIAKDSTPETATRTLGRAASQGFSPPEQVLGTGTDVRSDVYALGAILYNLLTNTMPPAAHERITGKTIVPLSHTLPEIPPLLDAAVMKALELNVNLRQQSICELAQTLDLVQSGGANTATVRIAGVTETLSPSQPGAAVHLPSVQIPSSRASAGLASASVRLDQPPPPDPEPSNRPWIAILAGLSIPTLLALAGFWYWQSQQDITPQVVETPPVSEEALPPQQDTPADLAAGQRTAGDDARPPPVDDLPADPAPATASSAALGVAATAATAAAAQAALNAKSETAATAPQKTAPATASFQPSTALPSIFSSEQPASGTPARPAGGGSLLDVFEQQRATQAPESTKPAAGQPLTPSRPAPLPMPVSPPKPLTVEQPKSAKPATTSRTTTKPPAKPKTTAKTKPKSSTPSSTPPRSSSASSASSWGFQYKGAEKKD